MTWLKRMGLNRDGSRKWMQRSIPLISSHISTPTKLRQQEGRAGEAHMSSPASIFHSCLFSPVHSHLLVFFSKLFSNNVASYSFSSSNFFMAPPLIEIGHLNHIMSSNSSIQMFSHLFLSLKILSAVSFPGSQLLLQVTVACSCYSFS